MSQSSFLEDAASWSPAECQEKLQFALPKLLSFFNASADNVTDVMQVICQSFIPVIPIQEAEDRIFSKLSEMLVIYFNQVFDDICKSARGDNPSTFAQEEISILLGTNLKIVESMETCVLHMLKTEVDLLLSQIHSLPHIVLQIVQSSYSHCKNSNDIYGDLLGAVSGPLSTLFKKVHSLQSLFISLVEKISFSAPTEEDLTDMCLILQGFFEIAQIASSLDVKIMITMWKSISRYASQYKEQLCDRLELNPMLASLSDDIVISFTQLLQLLPQNDQGDNKAFIKNVKVVGFQMKVLCMLTKEFQDYLGDSIPHIYHLILVIQRSMPPSLQSADIPQPYIEEIEKQIGLAVEPLLSYLTSNRIFMQCVAEEEQDLSEALYLPWCLTLLRVLDVLHAMPEDVQDKWIKPKVYREDRPTLPILKAVFKAMTECSLELNYPVRLPGVMCKGKPQRQVCLYEHVATRLSAFVASIPAKYFSLVEETLLENVLSKNELTACTAIDVWCFAARYGTADLCRDQCHFLTNLLITNAFSPSPECCHLVVLIKRLFKFLAPQHQEEFLQSFPVSSHFGLWSYISFEFLPSSQMEPVVETVLTQASAIIQHWLNTTQNTASDALKLSQACLCLRSVYSALFKANDTVPSSHHQTIKETCTKVFLAVSVEDVSNYTVMRLMVSNLVEVLAYIAFGQDDAEILKILSHLSILLSTSDTMKFASLVYLQALGRKVFSPSFEQTQILQLVPVIFSQLLSDDSPAVHQRSLEVFSVFAEETTHETMVPDSIQSNDRVQEAVVTYLNQLANNGSLTACDLSVIQQQTDELHSYHKSSSEDLYTASEWPSGSAPARTADQADKAPASKRARQEPEPPADSDFKEVLKTLQNCVDSLCSWRAQHPFPQWVTEDIKKVHQQMENRLYTS